MSVIVWFFYPCRLVNPPCEYLIGLSHTTNHIHTAILTQWKPVVDVDYHVDKASVFLADETRSIFQVIHLAALNRIRIHHVQQLIHVA